MTNYFWNLESKRDEEWACPTEHDNMRANTQGSHWLGMGGGQGLPAPGYSCGDWGHTLGERGAYSVDLFIFCGKLEVLAVLWGGRGATEIPDSLSLLMRNDNASFTTHEHSWAGASPIQWVQDAANPPLRAKQRKRFLTEWPSKPGSFLFLSLQTLYQSAIFQVTITSKNKH